MNANSNSVLRLVKQTCDQYQTFVKKNFDLLGELEVGLKWISYVVAGQSKNTSPVFSELIYTSSNILTLINDTIIRKATRADAIPHVKLLLGFNEEHFRIALTVIDYLEVFLEISCLRFWGFRGKWLAITAIQLCKTVLRLIYLVKKHVGFLLTPPCPPLTSKQRKIAQEQFARENGPQQEQKSHSGINMTFTLKRSGRTLRTISAAPCALGRSWKVPDDYPSVDDKPKILEDQPSTPLDNVTFVAEVLHTIRPIAHFRKITDLGWDEMSGRGFILVLPDLVLALRVWGQESWKPWLMGLGMDATSLHLIGDPQALNRHERAELRLRAWGLLYYLLRSPFFDKHSKDKIILVLKKLSKTIPGAKFICNPVMEYLPVWQKVYFYTWAN